MTVEGWTLRQQDGQTHRQTKHKRWTNLQIYGCMYRQKKQTDR